jgi:hypothetical protein
MSEENIIIKVIEVEKKKILGVPEDKTILNRIFNYKHIDIYPVKSNMIKLHLTNYVKDIDFTDYIDKYLRCKIIMKVIRINDQNNPGEKINILLINLYEINIL